MKQRKIGLLKHRHGHRFTRNLICESCAEPYAKAVAKGSAAQCPLPSPRYVKPEGPTEARKHKKKEAL